MIRLNSERGFVLVTVLWVLAILTVIAIGFGRRAVLDRRAAVYNLDHYRALEMARGAAQRGIAELRNKLVVDILTDKTGYTGYDQQCFQHVNMLEGEEEYYTLSKGEEFKDDECRFELRDEDSRISVNMAPPQLLEGIKGLSFSSVEAIVRRREGKEEEEETKGWPQPFLATEEVRHVKGITDKEWFGSQDKPGLRELVTCWGDGKLNVNTASREVLMCIPEVDTKIIDAIVDYRVGPDGELGTEDDLSFPSFSKMTEDLKLDGKTLYPIMEYCTDESQFFTITGIATRRKGKIRAQCAVTVQLMGPNAKLLHWQEGLLDSEI